MFNALKGQNNSIKETFINLRPLLVVAVALATGTAFCYAAVFCGVNLLFSLLTLIPFVFYVVLSRKKVGAVIISFLFLLCLGLGMGGFALRIESYHAQSFAAGEYTVEGEIEAISKIDYGYQILLKNVKLDHSPADGKLQTTVYANSLNGEEGMIISFVCEVSPLGSAYRYNNFRSDLVLKNVKYQTTVSSAPVLKANTNNPFTLARRAIKRVLYTNLSAEQASLAYALTTGDTSGVAEGLITSVRYGGVAHLFAVSGLHIGLVYAVLLGALKKLKTPQFARLLLSLSGAFLFCGVCGFSPSSLRAFFICVGTAFCSFIGVKADGTEGAAFSCSMILLINPVYLFSLGFQLSALAYVAIVLFVPAAQKFFAPAYKKFPQIKKPLSLLVTTFCVQLFLFPLMLNTFGYVSLWGILINPILLPLFSLYFPILLLGILLSCLFPGAAFALLFLPGAVLFVFAQIFWFVDFSTLLIRGFFLGMGMVILFYLLLILLSGRINLKWKKFSPLVCFLSVALLFNAITSGYVPAGFCYVKQSCYYDNFCCALVQTENSCVLLVNGKANAARLQTFLLKNTAKLDAVIICAKDANACVNTLLVVPFDKIYVRKGENIELQTKEIYAANHFALGGVRYSFTEQNSLRFETAGVKGVFNGVAQDADFSVFSKEECDGLIFTINRGILSVSQ